MTPGSRLRRARKLKGKSLRQLEELTQAKGLKISRSTLSNIERETYAPNIRQIRIICLCLDMSADWWLFEKGAHSFSISTADETLPKTARIEILKANRLLNALLARDESTEA